jgi:polyadenylate-binding protein
MLQRGGNRNFRYAPNARNTPDSGLPPPGVMAMLPVQLEMGGVPVAAADTGVPQPLPISALASALASAPPEQQRAVCSVLESAIFCLLSCIASFFEFHFG